MESTKKRVCLQGVVVLDQDSSSGAPLPTLCHPEKNSAKLRSNKKTQLKRWDLVLKKDSKNASHPFWESINLRLSKVSFPSFSIV